MLRLRQIRQRVVLAQVQEVLVFDFENDVIADAVDVREVEFRVHIVGLVLEEPISDEKVQQFS